MRRRININIFDRYNMRNNSKTFQQAQYALDKIQNINIAVFHLANTVIIMKITHRFNTYVFKKNSSKSLFEAKY